MVTILAVATLATSFSHAVAACADMQAGFVDGGRACQPIHGFIDAAAPMADISVEVEAMDFVFFVQHTHA